VNREDSPPPEFDEVPFPEDDAPPANVVPIRPVQGYTAPRTGPTPPHDAEAERELLSAVLIACSTDDRYDGPLLRGDGRKLATLAADALRSVGPEAFYLDRNRVLAAGLLAMIDAGTPTDPLLVEAQIKSMGQWELIGGGRAIGELLDRSGSVKNASHYALRVTEKARLRQWAETARQLEASALGEAYDVDAFVERSKALVAETAARTAPAPLPAASMVDKLMAWKARVESPEQRRCVPTGIAKLDERLDGGLGRGWLVVVLAPPKQRKTALAVNNFQAHAMSQGLACLYIGEGCKRDDLVGDRDLIDRFMARESNVPLRAQRNGDLSSWQWGAASNAMDRIAQWRWRSLPMRSADAIVESARAFVVEHGALDMLCVDYVQIVPNGIDEERLSISYTTRILQQLAGELDCVVVALSQPTNTDAKHKAELGLYDGKGSGSIAADCDLLLVPTGDVHDGMTKGPRAGLSAPGFRHGEPFKIELGELVFNGARMCFEG
jgi:replicative DNA helicase